MTQLFLLLLALFLFPIAVYCSILGMINRRPRPLMVAGTWDFLGVLLATSGFLLFVGPALVSGTFRQSLQELPFQRESTHLEDAIAEVWAAWWTLWLLYYLLILGGAAFLIWTRRDTAVIYNVDPRTLDGVLAGAAQRLGLEIERRGNRLYFHALASAPAASPSTAIHAADQPWSGPTGDPATQPGVRRHASAMLASVVDIEPFPLLSNISLHWRSGGPAARADLERELRQGLSETSTADTQVGGWLLSLSALLFMVILLLTAAFIAIVLINASRR